ncbi:MAG: hypothetical protein ACRDIE_25480, partial [Chloroflexota bacterium]
MAQVKIYGLREQLDPVKARLSDIIHDCAMDALPPKIRAGAEKPYEKLKRALKGGYRQAQAVELTQGNLIHGARGV